MCTFPKKWGFGCPDPRSGPPGNPGFFKKVTFFSGFPGQSLRRTEITVFPKSAKFALFDSYVPPSSEKKSLFQKKGVYGGSKPENRREPPEVPQKVEKVEKNPTF